MADKQERRMGTRIEGAAASQLDPAKMVVLVSRPTDPEVEGQALGGEGFIMCPWCDPSRAPTAAPIPTAITAATPAGISSGEYVQALTLARITSTIRLLIEREHVHAAVRCASASRPPEPLNAIPQMGAPVDR